MKATDARWRARARLTSLSFALALAACSCDDPTATGPADDTQSPGPSTQPEAPSPPDAGVAPPARVALVLQVGADVAPAVAARVEAWLRIVEPTLLVAPAAEPVTALRAAAARIIAIGDTSARRAVLPFIDDLAPEGFALVSGIVDGTPVFAAAGVGDPADRFGRGANGNGYGAYALLEELGFSFLHPLAPRAPAVLPDPWPLLSRTEAPRWPVRNIHLHTMHPLELTDMLNGWGPGGTDDEAGWQAMLPDWDNALEWLVANRQNEVEWVLLEAESWIEFSMSAARHDRLRELVVRGHAFGIAVGIDTPIVQEQQHTFRLVRGEGDRQEILRSRVDWLMSAGFDFLSTESGTTEFTHPAASDMLALMNALTAHLEDTWDAPARIKAHVSSGQVADGYTDPFTGGPLNFNHLASVADPRLAVLPHTVQFYGLDDPVLSYGNDSFLPVLDYLGNEAGRREVIWHPETAYWVSFDLDVPLFFPLYAERRLHDLRLIAQREDAGTLGFGALRGAHMQGQNLFSSGWEWGGWLNDVVAARAVWDPLLAIEDDGDAFVAALAPFVRTLGPDSAAAAQVLRDVARDQRDLLILGLVDGAAPDTLVRRTGQAYLQGFEPFDDIGALGERYGFNAPSHQPARLGLVELRSPLHAPPDYGDDVEPLLAAMAQTFADHAARWEPLAVSADPLTIELRDALAMNALRARQIHGLYDYVDSTGWIAEPALDRLADARAALDSAIAIVAERELHYRAPVARIAAWRNGPTAYEWGYLWTVHSLYYWWRDELLAVDAPLSPCVLNIIDPLEVAMGEGTTTDLVALLASLGQDGPLGDVTACLDAPTEAPTLPPAGLRDGP